MEPQDAEGSQECGASLRRGVHKCGEGRGVRHRYGKHVWILGLGWRSLLDGFSHRTQHDDRGGPEAFR